MTEPVCDYCGQPAEFVGGDVIYPHRPDLASKRFWRCAPCGAYVGCRPKNKKYGQDGTQPMGRLANAELRKAKMRAHAAFDPLWKDDAALNRRQAYAWLAGRLNIPLSECHIGMFDVPMCDATATVCKDFKP